MMRLTPQTETTASTRAQVVRLVRSADADLLSNRSRSAALRSVVGITSLVDCETAGHVQRVADYACRLAQACGWTTTEIDQLAVAAVLHDLGKIAVPTRLLTKPGPLTSTERIAVERHTTFAGNLLATCRSPELRMAREVAAHHHERWDGGGYPHGLAGAAIPLAARVVALADVFDALTSDRPYRRAMSVETALGIIAEGGGTHFDPALTAAFLNIHGEARRCA